MRTFESIQKIEDASEERKLYIPEKLVPVRKLYLSDL